MTPENERHDHPAALPDQTLLAACAVTRTRRSGPGGQHRNKVQTAIVLVHRPTGLRAEASERRSQQQNLGAALFRLRIKLAIETRSERGEGPGELWRSRCRGGRVAINPLHADYPAMLAEALDALAAHDHEAPAAAAWLGCTATQLVNLIRHEPAALVATNAARLARGLPRLR